MTFPRRTLLALALVTLLPLAACDKLLPGKPVAYNAVDITGANYGRTLSLQDADGRTRPTPAQPTAPSSPQSACRSTASRASFTKQTAAASTASTNGSASHR